VTAPLVYLVAGEPSGDRLGASLMQALSAERPGMRFAGVGGPGMQAAGLDPLFDNRQLAVMGIAEVLPRLPGLLARIRETAEDCLRLRPAAIVTIDSPSFGLRVSARVRARDPSIRTIHYVAPSVWAWRPGRARHMARFTDHVLALLPFEPPFMEAAGMTCDFVGHPVAERRQPGPAEIAAIRDRLGIGAERRMLLVAPGSRAGEVRRMGPLFAEVVRRLAAADPRLSVAVPVGEGVADAPEALLPGLAPALVTPEMGEDAKHAAFAAADAALVKSGTVSLEMAAAGTPHVSAYRTSWMTAAIVRRLIRVSTANLVNLVADAPVVPEFLQERATPDLVTPAVARLLEGTEDPRPAFDRVLGLLGRDGPPPSLRAARSVLGTIGR
jgi:lipid-A-disaccharide synthase